jgi:hypothetical protein
MESQHNDSPPDRDGRTEEQRGPAPPDWPDPERAAWVFRVGLALGLAVVVVLAARLIRLFGPCLASAVSG